MTGLETLAAALAFGVVVAWVQRLRFGARARALTARIDGLCAGLDPAPFPDSELVAVLRAAERLAIETRRISKLARERDTLLSAALDTAPVAIVLFNDVGRISLVNEAARSLFFEGQDPTAQDFLSLLGRAPDALRRALASDGDELFSIDDADGERQTYHLSRRRLRLGGEPHVLVLVRSLSRELHRQEADVWRRVIRVFSHELNNSLAPVSSLVHSAKVLVAGSSLEPKLTRVFDTIDERAKHLQAFLEGYARFARLPLPRKKEVAWAPLIARLSEMWSVLKREGELPAQSGWFDEAQIEQVLINLVKNAIEAGSPEVSIAVTTLKDGVRVSVSDRGPGMTEEVMRNALVPFYSTKEGGSGLGLPLCREIVEAHGGGLRIEARNGGGVTVRVRLPGRTTPDGGRLTLTRS